MGDKDRLDRAMDAYKERGVSRLDLFELRKISSDKDYTERTWTLAEKYDLPRSMFSREIVNQLLQRKI